MVRDGGLTVAQVLPPEDEIVNNFGVRLYFDETGTPALLSFGQFGSSYTGKSERMAERAEEQAMRQARLESARKPEDLLDIVGLSNAVLDQYPRELSGGQCQRASFARALAVHPKVLVADEPVSALDVSVQARILNLLRDLRRNLDLAVILIAHDLAVVRNVCDRVCVMHKGLFADHGQAEEVFAHPKSEYTRELLAAVPDVARELARRNSSKSCCT